MDIDWPRRSALLNRSLLVAALLLAALGIASVLAQPVASLAFASLPTVALIASAVWMLLAYLAGRSSRTALSRWMLVLFSLAWLALGFYLLPEHTLALLPATLLPVGLAVLLLRRRAALFITLVAILIPVAVAFEVLPSSLSPISGVPLTQLEFGVVVVAAASILLAIMLLPLRGANLSLGREVAASEAARAQLAQERRAIEQERDAALNTIARQRQHLEALAAHIRDGVIGVNGEGEIIHANTVAQDISREALRDTGGQALLARVETALAPAGGDMAPVDVVPLPSFGLSPEEAYTHVLVDRREQARLARLRGELLGLLTDEMRNPLTSMVTALDLTLGQNDLPEEVDRVLIGARQSGQRLLELVTILLEISQIEQDPGVLRRANTSLSRVIEAGIAQMSPLAQRGAVTVSVEHAGDSVISVDGERIQRAFAYLLEQALRQSPPYSVVHVRTRWGDGQLVVQITDQGPGRASQQSEQLFRQGADERNASSLGLIYSKLVIESHGGRVWAESSGQGSSYSFALPAERQELVER